MYKIQYECKTYNANVLANVRYGSVEMIPLSVVDPWVK